MTTTEVRRADFLMALAYATDLATGQSRDFALRGCIVAMRLAERAGLDLEERRNVYHQALLRYVGCNADTHLLAAAFGDEIAMRQDLAHTDLGNHHQLVEVFVRALNRVFADAPPDQLAGLVEQGLSHALHVSVPILAGHCEVARRIGARLGLSDQLCESLGQIYERWDGHGLPHGLKGEAVKRAVRVVTLAQDAVVLLRLNGPEAMAKAIAERRDGAYEAALADLFLADAGKLTEGIENEIGREAILALEPRPHAMLDEAACEEAFLAIADMIDMRMPFTLGHSRAVAALADAAGKRMGLPGADIRNIRWAGYIHDLGELSVPVATWQRPGPLSPREADAARLHPYHGERALAALGDAGTAVAALVGHHHERLDGSGYHRGIRGSGLSPAARVLAAAEAFQTAREARPHRPAMSDAAAAAKLRSAVRDGSLDPDAVEAVLAAAGQPSRNATQPRLAGLTPREIEVLRLIASGLTAKEAARRLEISPKTADNHIQNLYSKIGVTTRAGAALYALEQGLVRQESSPA
jgi:HD-GYP domain-containing protein (c-di-GMP phosphodiesterase class II)